MPYKDSTFLFSVEPEDSFSLRFLPTGRRHFTITELFPEHGLANFYDQYEDRHISFNLCKTWSFAKRMPNFDVFL